MKTSRNDRRPADLNTNHLGKQVRRQRTMTAFACESLEGRKLMTGFAGASGAMMGHGPVDMATMTGDKKGFAQGDSQGSDGMQGDKSLGRDFQSQGATSQDTSNSATDSDSSGGKEGIRSFLAMDDMKRDSGPGGSGGHDDAQGDIHDDAMMGSMREMPAGDGFRGDMMGRGDGGDMSNVPMAGPTGQGDSTTNTQLKTDMDKLSTDSQAIHDKSQVTPALLATVRKDLEAIDAAKTGDADATALKTLKTDETTIFSSNTAPTDAQQTQLQADHDAVLKSQGVSQTLIDQLATDRLAVKTASNFTDADKATLDADQKTIEADRTADQAATDSTSANSTDSTTAATPGTTTATPAIASAATPDPTGAATPAGAATSAATPDPTGAATPPVAPDQANAPAAAPMTSSIDPAMMQNTATAAPQMTHSMSTTGGMGHHGHAGFANFSHHTAGGHGANHSTSFGGGARHNSRR